MMTLNIKIGRLGLKSQTLQLFSQSLYLIFCIAKLVAESVEGGSNVMLGLFQTLLGVVDIDITEQHRCFIENMHRKSMSIVLAVKPDTPQEKRINNFGIL